MASLWGCLAPVISENVFADQRHIKLGLLVIVVGGTLEPVDFLVVVCLC